MIAAIYPELHAPDVGWSWPSIYVAAPYADAAMVRGVHSRLVRARFRPTSAWAETAFGPENLDEETARAAIESNDAGLLSSDGVLVLARDGAGGEMFCEIAKAIMCGIKVFWCGRMVLSAYRSGVVRCDDVNDAIAALEVLR